MTVNHPLLQAYPTVPPYEDPDLIHTFIGTHIRKSFISVTPPTETEPSTRTMDTVSCMWDCQGEELFEFIDVAEAAMSARDTFTVVELGAGFGRWLVYAEMFRRAFNPTTIPRYIGIEGDPVHYQWMLQHFRDNGLDPADHDLRNNVIATSQFVWFMKNNTPAEWYGQAVIMNKDMRVPSTLRRGVSIKSILKKYDWVDLLDADLQGIELDVFTPAIKTLNEKCARVHIGTHSPEIEKGLRILFTVNGWTPHFDFPGMGTRDTPYGPVSFQDGAQSWINPKVMR